MTCTGHELLRCHSAATRVRTANRPLNRQTSTELLICTCGFDACAVLHLDEQENSGFSVAVLVERTAPRASARSSVRAL